MHDRFIKHNTSSFHYRVFGSGPKLLFCFHGYGRDSYTFGFLQTRLGLKYTIVALDAPFHGHTQWDNPEFHPNDLVEIVAAIRRELRKTDGKISLLGFSMGGRIALHLTQMLSPNVERVVLLAPDGLRNTSLLWFSTRTWIGSRLFDYTVNNPNWLVKSVSFGERLGLLNKNFGSFIQYYIKNKEERISLYKRWTIMRKFKPDLTTVKRTIKGHAIKVRMLFGSYDKVIHYAGGQRFLKRIENYASVKIIDAGHDLLREWHAPAIAGGILKRKKKPGKLTAVSGT